MGLATDSGDKKRDDGPKSVVPRSLGKPIAPSPPKVAGGPVSEKPAALVGTAAAPKSERAPETTRDPAPLARPLDSAPLLPARTPNKIAIVQGTSLRPSVSAMPRANVTPFAMAAPIIPPPPPMPQFDTTIADVPRETRAPEPGPRFDTAMRWQSQHPTPPPFAKSIPPAAKSDDGLSYHVYTPDVLASQAMPQLRTGSMIIPPSRSTAIARACMLLVGLCVVFGTAAIVIVGTADERAKTTSAANAISTNVAPPPEAPVPPPPTVVSAPPPPPIATTPDKHEKPEKPSKKKRTAPPPSIKNATMPPNPYGGK
jgi:hypothetical protein